MIGVAVLLAAQAAATVTQGTNATPPAPSAIEAISAVQLPISESADGQYAGPGWDQLIADGTKAQFFMIGEQHLTHDIATFAKAAQKALASRGYTHAAFEVGPYSMRHAEGLIRSGSGKLAEYIRQPGHGFVYPFLFFTEEVELMEQVVATSPDKAHALWGVDQEFVASGPVAVELLQGWAMNDAQRQAVSALEAKLASAPQMVGDKPWTEFAALESAFANHPQASRYLRELKLSNEIYAPFTGRGGSGYEANLARETYMKRNFLEQFDDAQRRTGRSPKVFMKFGGYHAQKGFSGTNVPALGNFLYEWGLSHDHDLVNVMVECVGGLARNPQTQETMPCEPYFSKDALLSKLPKPNRLTLLDLRPLRKQLRRLPDLDQESKQVILSFDYYLAIKDVTPGTPVAPVAAK